jgi:beta-glucosidase
MSDWGATHSTKAALLAGLNLEMPGGRYFGAPLAAAVASDPSLQPYVDDSAARILRSMTRIGLMDHPPRSGPFPYARDARDAKRIAENAAVLLKNEGGTLPLDRNAVRSIALIGWGVSPAPTFGGGSGWTQPGVSTSALDAFRTLLGSRVLIEHVYAQGIPFVTDDPTIDALSLAPRNARPGQHGLLRERFANPYLQGRPETRVDPYVDFNWEFPGGVDGDAYFAFSIRWSGTLTAPQTGWYMLGSDSPFGTRLTVDGRRLVDNWSATWRRPGAQSARVFLQSGKHYPIVFDFRGDAQYARLFWVPPAATQTPDIARAVAAARRADVAVVFADRDTLALTGGQSRLIEAVAAANPHTVVVLNCGSAIAMGEWLDRVPAVLDMWYGGEESGAAAADLLFGMANPSGKLPITFPAYDDVVPARVSSGRTIVYREGRNVAYRWYDSRGTVPEFPFGYGLSYTSFILRNLRIASTMVKSGEPVTIEADVFNSGKRAGAEVVQLYVGFPAGAGEPPKQLKGFEKVALRPAESRHLVFTLAPSDLSTWQGRWQEATGTFTAMIGDSSQDLPLQSRFSVTP